MIQRLPFYCVLTVQIASQKLPCSFLFWLDKDLIRSALLDDQSLIHEDDLIADLSGKSHLMSDDYHRQPLG